MNDKYTHYVYKGNRREAEPQTFDSFVREAKSGEQYHIEGIVYFI